MQASRAALDEINQRWAGAKCQMRVTVMVKKGRDGDGWSQSPWMCNQPKASKDEWFCFRLRVSDREAIRHLMDDKHLLAGARFIAEGWGFEQPKKAAGLYLDLRFADAPARVRWVFTAKAMSMKSPISPQELVHIERYMRVDAYQLSPVEERLVAAPSPVPAPPPIRPVATPAPAMVRPELRMVAVAVRPARAAPGDEVRLVVMYEVSGLPPGTPFEVTETRRLMAGERVLATFEDRVPRTAGTVTSELPVQVPAGLAPGMYALHATVSLAGIGADGTAFFQVGSSGSGGGP